MWTHNMNDEERLLTPFEERLNNIWLLFTSMHGQNASNWQIETVKKFREEYPECNEDLDFAFEILAGKHKVGFTFYNATFEKDPFMTNSLKELVNKIKYYTEDDKSETQIRTIMLAIPIPIRQFMINLMNRVYRLGYTNRSNMVTDKHCMLAKSYPDGVKYPNKYYIQEKLNGNRCIAYYNFDEEKWEYISRSQKPMNVDFDLSNFDKTLVYDGEVMRRGRMDNRDFAATSGLINSKYYDKSSLVYFIYDILDDSLPYEDRLEILNELKSVESEDVSILRTLAVLQIQPNPELNSDLDVILDEIVERGGEGVILRQYDAPYHHSRHSGDRQNYLLKYKKTKTADLRIVDWNEGKGKYEGMIGSFVCEDDEGKVRVNVAGMTDDIRMSDPEKWIGKIIEVAYFEMSRSRVKDTYSLQFPRIKGIRHDKDETSLF